MSEYIAGSVAKMSLYQLAYEQKTLTEGTVLFKVSLFCSKHEKLVYVWGIVFSLAAGEDNCVVDKFLRLVQKNCCQLETFHQLNNFFSLSA